MALELIWKNRLVACRLTCTVIHDDLGDLYSSSLVNGFGCKSSFSNEPCRITLPNPSDILWTHTSSSLCLTQTASFSDTCCGRITESFQFAASRCQQLRFPSSAVRWRRRPLSPPAASGTAGPHRARCCQCGGKLKLCCMS